MLPLIAKLQASLKPEIGDKNQKIIPYSQVFRRQRDR